MEGDEFGRYRLLDLLGSGGMGEVWRAFDTGTDRIVALKLLPANLVNDEVFKERFRREARAAAALNEPHVVPIHNFGEIDGRLYVDMRLIEGKDLQTVLADGPLSAGRAVQVVEQIAAALAAAHKVGLVHRDVKPSNILLGEHDFAYLIDFGIAHASGQSGLTGTGNMIGTWQYMAPERFTTGEVDPRSDTYALACVLYESLTCSRPFPGDSVEQQIAGHLTVPPPRPSITRPGVPADLDSVIARGMAKEPGARFQSSYDMARAARAALTAPTARPAPPSTPPPTPRPAITPPPSTAPVPAGPPSSPSMPARPAAPTTQQPAWSPPQHLPAFAPGPGPSGYGLASGPPPSWGPPSEPARQDSPWWKRRAVLGSAAAAAVVAVVLATVLAVGGGDDSASTTPQADVDSSTTTSKPADEGPIDGAYEARYAAETAIDGAPHDDKGGTEVWFIKSACREGPCVATATKTSGDKSGWDTAVLDDLSGTWTAVNVTKGSCKKVTSDKWEMLTLKAKPDKSLEGEYRYYYPSSTCAGKQRVTFERTGPVGSLASVADPDELKKRVESPASAFRGKYRRIAKWANGSPDEATDYVVRTDCLRTGDRCVSYLDAPGTWRVFVFGDGKFVGDREFDATCKAGGKRHTDVYEEYPLPPGAPTPVTLLEGRGHLTNTGDCPTDSDFTARIEYTGD